MGVVIGESEPSLASGDGGPFDDELMEDPSLACHWFALIRLAALRGADCD